MKACVAGHLLKRLQRKIGRLELRLDGKRVLTEAATGKYAVTPVIAGLAGATRIYALAKASRFGSEEDIRRDIWELAPAELRRRIEVLQAVDEIDLGSIDIVTNSGHLRPLREQVIERLGRGAMVSLMYDAWEFREADVDLDLCAQHEVPVVAVNEAHPELETYKTNALLVLGALERLGVEVFDASVAVVADNLIGGYVEQALSWLGAHVHLLRPDQSPDWRERLMACSGLEVLVLVVRRYSSDVDAFLRGPDAAAHLGSRSPDLRIVLLMGDVDLAVIAERGVECYPRRASAAGHMAINTHETGYNAIVSLQTGGLKVGEIVSRLYDESGDWAEVRSRLHNHPLARWMVP